MSDENRDPNNPAGPPNQGFGPPNQGYGPPPGQGPQPGQVPPQGYGPPPGQVPPQGYGPPPGQVPPQGYGPPPGQEPPKKKMSGKTIGIIAAAAVAVIVAIVLVLVFTLGGGGDSTESAQKGSLKGAAEKWIDDTESIGGNPSKDDLKNYFNTWFESSCAQMLVGFMDLGFDGAEDEFVPGTDGSKPTVKSADEDGDTGTVTFESDGEEESVPFVKEDGRWKVSCGDMLGGMPTDFEMPSFEDMPSY